jgi:hypothetical protein
MTSVLLRIGAIIYNVDLVPDDDRSVRVSILLLLLDGLVVDLGRIRGLH